MPNELENRLGRALGSIPLTGQSRERARQLALDALAPARPSRRPVAVKVLVASIAAVCLITAGVALAASGGVEFHVGRPAPSSPQLQATRATASSPLPAGSASFIVEVGGRVWSAGAHSLRPIAGRLSTIAVEPWRPLRTRGKGSICSAPVASRSGRVAFTHRVHGRVIAASWSPLPIRIAFLEQTRSGYVMHDMWGTGSHDRRGPGRLPGRTLLALGLARGGVRPGGWPGGNPQPDQRRGQDAATRLLDPQGPGDRVLALERVAGDRGREAARDRGYDGVAAASLHRACCGDAVAGVARRSEARHRRGQPPPESQRRLVRCAIDCPYGARSHHDPCAGSTGTWDCDRDRSAAGHERHGRHG